MGTFAIGRRAGACLLFAGAELTALVLGGCSGRNELGTESSAHESPVSDATPGVAMPDGGDPDAMALPDASAMAISDATEPVHDASQETTSLGDGSDAGDSSSFPAPTCSGWGTSTTALSVVPTGYVATGFDDGSAIVRSSTLGLLRKLQVHDGPVLGIATSRDGSLLATLGDGEIRLWNVADGTKVESALYAGPTDVTQLAVSQDNHSIIVLGSRSDTFPGSPPLRLTYSWTVTVLDLSQQTSWLASDDYPVDSAFFCGAADDVCVVHKSGLTVHHRTDGATLREVLGAQGTPSPDGTFLASIGNGTLDITRTADGVTTHQAGASFSEALLFSIDGSVLSGLSVPGNFNEAWSLPSFMDLGSWSWTDPAWLNLPVWRIGSGPGPNLMFSDLAGKLGLADGATGQFGINLPTTGQQGVPEVIRFSPDGKLVATLATFNFTPSDRYEPSTGSLVIWDAVTHDALWSRPNVGTKGGLHAIAFSPDSTLIYADGIRDARDGHMVRSLTNGGGCFAPTPDGSVLYACGRAPYPVEVYDLVGQTQKTFDGGFVSEDLAISPQATRLVVTFGPSGLVPHMGLRMYPLPDGGRAWDADAGEDDGTASIVFSPDGKLVALTKLFTPGIRLFEAATGQALDILEAAELVGRVAFSPNGRFVAANTSHGVDLIRVSDGQVAKTLPLASKKAIGVAFSPSGEQLLIGNGNGHIASFCHVLDDL
jgi:hypothetical protein